MKAIMKYPGSKWSLAEWIISFFPPHHSYLESFFGSGAVLFNKPAVELIQRFNYLNVLVYADPPYVLSTRHGKQYRYEMDDQDQNNLLDVLLAHKGPVLLSGYDNALYNDRLRSWHRREILWMNFEPIEQMQLTIYE